MFTLQNRVAVVTGAGGGIGRGVAEALGGRGCTVALVDVDERGMAETAQRLTALGVGVSVHAVDVSDRAQMEALPPAVAQAHGPVHILVNNAGVALAGPFASYSIADLEWIVGVNLWGVLHGCRFFLPTLHQADMAQIVNIASIFGLVGVPSKTGYCTTKFAVRGFSEALGAELAGTPVGVTCVYPGAVATGLIDNGRALDPARGAAEARFVATRGLAVAQVAARIVRAIERRERRVVIGRETMVIDRLARMLPGPLTWMVGRFARRLPFL